MTVAEIIEELQKQDPKAKVVLGTEHTPDYVYASETLRLRGTDLVLISS
jgi:hypothetical protein